MPTSLRPSPPVRTEFSAVPPSKPVTGTTYGNGRNGCPCGHAYLRELLQWRNLPARFGPWQTVHKRHRLWCSTRGLGQFGGLPDGSCDSVVSGRPRLVASRQRAPRAAAFARHSRAMERISAGYTPTYRKGLMAAI
ncbi:hypothetical protein B1H19_01680 [Streptomyces gilvosporeus]|uniref:Transposase n=1 Tax=Streptomyces gilvosporeus TaxID=553510 RepID=A0A1V0TJK7_9ACTN|nr:hypothetical protein B1H19_01680 [Streptomyces gilvosporeus]